MVSRFLLDTNILAELRKRDRCNEGVRRWFDDCPEQDLYLSVLVLGEVRRGVELLRRRDPTAAGQLEAWLQRMKNQFAPRILEVNHDICQLWGIMGLQQPVPPIDGLLAATALHHDLILVTRNVTDIERTGVRFINPFSNIKI